MRVYQKTLLVLLLTALALTVCGCEGKLSEPERYIICIKSLMETPNVDSESAKRT